MEPEDLLNIFKINEIIKENEFRRASGDNLKMNSIINVHEYHDLMMLTTPFSDKQTFQKNTFEKFMGELINYKNYLVQEGIYELGLYENYMSYLSVNGFYTKNEENALNTYYELQEKVKDIELKNAKA